jgi:hypothetical protein
VRIPPGERVVPAEKIRELCDRYVNDETVTAKELAAEVFVAPSTMRKYLREHGITPRRAHPDNRRGKLTRVVTPEEIERMRYLYWECHQSYQDIADTLGLTQGIVRYIFIREGIPSRSHSAANTNKKHKRERQRTIARYVSPVGLP